MSQTFVDTSNREGPCPGDGTRGNLTDCEIQTSCSNAKRCFILAHFKEHPCGWEYIDTGTGIAFFRQALIVDESGADNTPQRVPDELRPTVIDEVMKRFS